MKKLMSVLLFATLLVIPGCKEDPTYCYECTNNWVATSFSGFYEEGQTVTQHCGKTEEDAKKIEKAGTGETISGGVITTNNTNCVRK